MAWRSLQDSPKSTSGHPAGLTRPGGDAVLVEWRTAGYTNGWSGSGYNFPTSLYIPRSSSPTKHILTSYSGLPSSHGEWQTAHPLYHGDNRGIPGSKAGTSLLDQTG